MVKLRVVCTVCLFRWSITWKVLLIDMGCPYLELLTNPILGIDGDYIKQGAVDYWEAEVDSLKNDPDALNEFYRQFPRTESHAFRDESKQSLFNLN